jgi:hypothetical protein
LLPIQFFSQGALAVVVVLDQFTRNVHRGTAGIFANDSQAPMAQRTEEKNLPARTSVLHPFFSSASPYFASPYFSYHFRQTLNINDGGTKTSSLNYWERKASSKENYSGKIMSQISRQLFPLTS